MKKNSGFTLLELVVSVVVVGILTALAVPTFTSFIQNNRIQTLKQDFVSMLTLARSEAIKRGSPVSLCAASSTALTACGAATDWANGWILFTDPNSNGTIGSTANIIRVQNSFIDRGAITTNQSRITYNSIGSISAGNSTYTISATGCKGANSARTITIAPTGYYSVQTAACP